MRDRDIERQSSVGDSKPHMGCRLSAGSQEKREKEAERQMQCDMLECRPAAMTEDFILSCFFFFCSND